MNNARAGRLGRFSLYNQERTCVVRQIDAHELNRLAALGEIGWFEKNGRNFPCIQPKPAQSRTSGPLESKVSLVMTDSELNAEGKVDGERYAGVRVYGLNRFGRRDEAIVGNRVDQSMSKVEAWPVTHDDKAIVICAGKVIGATLVSLEELASL